MAQNSGAGYPDQAENSAKPSMSTGKSILIGTYQDLSKNPTSVNQKSGNHGGGAGEPKY